MINVTLIGVSDKARFLQTGCVKSQNNKFWLAENSTFIYKLPLHDALIGVWCALCEAGFVEPVLYSHRDVTFCEGERPLGRSRRRWEDNIKKLLRIIFRKLEGVVGTGWGWLRIGTGGGHLWVR